MIVAHDGAVRASSERGATGLEYAGILAAAAIVVAAIILGITRTDIPAAVSCEVGKILTSTGECAGGPPVTYGSGPGAGPGGGESQEPVDQQAVDDALDSVRTELEGGFFGVRSGNLDEIRDTLSDLSGPELDAVIAGMSDDELEKWVNELEDGWLGSGWDYQARRDLWSMIVSKASTETLDRLASFTDDLQPDFRDVGGDGAREDPESVANQAEWTDIPHELFVTDADDPDGPAVKPTDLRQGAIGDCWLIATMGAIAQQQPGLIEDAITANDNGTYTVRLYTKDGDPVYVTVTPDLPGIDGAPVFVKNPSGRDGPAELWPHLLEKAAAQYRGTYGDIESDWPSEAITMLTGTDPQTYQGGLFSNPDPPSLSSLSATLNTGGLILLSTDNKDRTSLYSDGTIVQRHAYYVQSVDESNGTVTIVNPWGLQSYPPITMSYEDFRASFIRYDVAQP